MKHEESAARGVEGQLRRIEPAGSTAAGNQLTPALLAEIKSASLKHMADALQTYAEWCGGVHDDLCPEDDTCDCSVKWVNDGVNSAHRFLIALAEACQMPRFYGVTVYDHNGAIITIEPNMLAGRDIGESEDTAIRAAIQQLCGFIGLSPAAREALTDATAPTVNGEIQK